MSVKPEIELTADGSHTLFVPSLNEHYHSVNGAIQESTHIFINTGLKACSKNEIRIFEVGFGTGLNAFLTILEACKQQISIHYTSVEAYPLDKSVTDKLNYTEGYAGEEKSLFYQLHEAQWDEGIPILPDFHLTKLEADFTQFDFSQLKNIDLIYFDAFAPDKQPGLWTQQIFDNLFKIAAENAILVTYCAKGAVRRMMQQAGFTVERLPGPPGKREMLRATKATSL
ncbi:tRNA (5-methylaminomethyl-2-thiouridine)(34)-methyltransferase MnmD [Dysgonomonas sp. 511]|uniref:tRNA (5-methylaminomethyl-2-thiouridine)(34)-methyltransferase MnmD n=1 Tax=Dysgonomonas sp. 511 TaxID=2302930 RepID=UPI0013D60B54|nr:tRNA (5-methylaminomethyl-2-thiouridine)(34)-methyltransferase MnmD [Dysgonomonas sp. 511]NDV78159.1 SAM-dependent methyltransferase [Dysgonomonas sp. 511]